MDNCCKNVCDTINDYIATANKDIEHSEVQIEYHIKKGRKTASEDKSKKRHLVEKSILENAKQTLKDKDICKC